VRRAATFASARCVERCVCYDVRRSIEVSTCVCVCQGDIGASSYLDAENTAVLPALTALATYEGIIPTLVSSA
jgi:hypothetical protein